MSKFISQHAGKCRCPLLLSENISIQDQSYQEEIHSQQNYCEVQIHSGMLPFLALISDVCFMVQYHLKANCSTCFLEVGEIMKEIFFSYKLHF